MQNLLKILENLLTNLLVFVAAYQHGKTSKEKEVLKHENEKLKAGIQALINSDFSMSDAADRMRDEK